MAVIDIGSASIRMVANGNHYSHVPRLGEGLVEGGPISDAALQRASQAFAALGQVISDENITEVVAVATAAARKASNTDELFAMAEAHLGVKPQLLSGEQEGELAFAGALSSVSADGPVLVFDVGGASTEFVAGYGQTGISSVFSCDIGAATITSDYFDADPPAASELSAALSVIELHMVDVNREIPDLANHITAGTVIGIGGAITTMAAVEIGMDTFDADALNGFVLTRDAAEDVFRTLATETLEDRVFNPGLDADRAPIIVGGACVVVEMMRQFGLEEIVVSTSGIIEGVAASVANETWATYTSTTNDT